MVWYDGVMKKIFLTLGAVFSLFSYSSDPLALDVLDGKFMICIPPTFETKKNVSHESRGLIFVGDKVKMQTFYTITEPDLDSGIPGAVSPSKSSLFSQNGDVNRVEPRHIRLKIIKDLQHYWYVIDRENLNFYQTAGTGINSDPAAYCVLIENKEAYDNYMKNIQIKHQEMIDKENLDRKRKRNQQLKDNQI